ncbi:MAG: insulinase family protein [Clostridiales bacterium]|nr:insulinase family protein [Clostridiales bacterium]
MHKMISYPNGLRLIMKKLDFLRSVSVGVWVGAGSAYEKNNINGISHFIEHMLFKGTSNRSSFDIADSIDKIGGQINAFTAKEVTCYYTKSIDEHLEKCIDILSDMFFNSTFDENELEKEKKVVLEEISMVEDSPEDVCHENLAKLFFEGNPLEQPIVGTAENVNNFDKDKLKKFMFSHYCPQNIVIAVAGNFDFDKLAELIDKYFNQKFEGQENCLKAEPAPKHASVPKTGCKIKQIEQASIAIGFPSPMFNTKESNPMMIASNVLGGSMSSRLFQKIREELGLAYSVYSYMSSYKNNGIFSFYCGTNPQNIEKAVKTVIDELKKFLKDGINDDEFERGKEQLKGNIILGQENTTSIMNVYGKMLLVSDQIFDLDQKLKEINSITKDDVMDVARKYLDFERACISCVANRPAEDLLQFLN